MDSITDTAFNCRGQQDLPSSMSLISVSNVTFATTTFKLDKDLQANKEHCSTHRHDKKRNIACRLIVVRYLA